MTSYYNDCDTSKVRVSRDYMNKNKLSFEDVVNVKFTNGNEFICKVCAFSDTISDGFQYDDLLTLHNDMISTNTLDNATFTIIPNDSITSSKKIVFNIDSNDLLQFNTKTGADNKIVSEDLEDICKCYLNGLVIKKGMKINMKQLKLKLVVNEINDNNEGYCKVNNSTKMSFTTLHSGSEKNIIGFDKYYEEINHFLMNKTHGGIVIEGEHGSGKTTLIKMIESTRCINCKNTSQTTQMIISELLKVSENEVIVIDDIDVLYKENKFIVLQVINQLTMSNKVIITSTSHLDTLLFNNGLIGLKITITPPSVEFRKQFLMNLNVPTDICDKLAKKLVGYLPRDMITLNNEAMSTLQFNTSSNTSSTLLTLTELMSDNKDEHKEYNSDDVYDSFMNAMNYITPSVLVGSETEFDRLTWDDIGGLEEVKQQMKEAIEWPITHSEQFKKLGIRPSHGVLLYGPSGCAKTSLVRASATMLNTSFITLSSASIYSPFVGDAEASVREAFRKARNATPCILFIDEIDTVVGIRSGGTGGDSVRDRVLSTLLNEMDGIEDINGVILVAASNRRELIDPALLRPGRFDCLIEVPLPDTKTREEIFKVALKDIPYDTQLDLTSLAEKTEGRSGADIKWIVSEACTKTLREDINAKTLNIDILQHLID